MGEVEMTDLQLYLAVGVPIMANVATVLLGFTLISRRIDDLKSDVSTRVDSLRSLFTEQLRRVEDVMDTRLRHAEEHLRP